MFKIKFPAPITVLMIVTIIGAAATWLLPAGKFSTLLYENNSFTVQTSGRAFKLYATQQVLDSLHILIPLEKFKDGDIRKAVSIPGTYHRLPQNRQGIIPVVEAPIKGIYDAIDIILFVLIIGGFMNIFQQTGAMEKGLTHLSYKMKGKEGWLIIILCFLLSFAGASFGMAEEGLVFFPIMTPLFLAAGYDLIVPCAVIFGGNQIGSLSSFSNPFATIIASNAAGVNWTDGFYERVIVFVVTTAVFIFYVERYGRKVKKNPTASFVYKYDGAVKSPYESFQPQSHRPGKLERKTRLLLFTFLLTFLVLIAGVIFFDWWLTEMSALFLSASIIIAIVVRMKERVFIEKFIKGAESLLSVAFIVGIARGVTIILNEGNISDTIVFYSAEAIRSMPPALFIVILLVLYNVFTLFIASSSGMAVVTMPIMGSLAVMAGVPGREIVNTYLYGMGIMGFITPTGLMLPCLAMVNVGIKAWIRFIYPLMIIMFIICAVFLIVGIRMR